MTKQQMDIITSVIAALDQVSVPTQLTETVSIPVYQCSITLKKLIIDEREAQKKAAQEAPEVEIGAPQVMSEEEVKQMMAQNDQEFDSSVEAMQ